ncbi:MAG: hypothetical protein KY475_11430, partial [Planctomycetes bacterium]|nr:hypothetical protein [Planctomycetota bacterium]
PRPPQITHHKIANRVVHPTVEGETPAHRWAILDLAYNATPAGPAYERDTLFPVAEFIAGIIAKYLRWHCRIRTDDGYLVTEIDPPREF